MKKLNWVRVFWCGLLAGTVWIILGSLVTALLGRDFAALPNNHLARPSAGFLLFNITIDLLEGISISLALRSHSSALRRRCKNFHDCRARLVVHCDSR